MLIAFISDVHGNLPALEAMAEDAKAQGVAVIMCAGDIVGYGPFPSEVCRYLEENNITCISGNYDRKVLDVINHGESVVDKLPKKKRELVFWTVKHTGKSAQRFLAKLPEKLEQQLPGGFSLLMVHGSPISNDDDIYPSITARGLRNKLGGARPDILVCGHTHVPFVKRIGRVLVANCGSAGHPVDGDPNPSYVIISTDQKAPRGRVRRFRYDVGRIVDELERTSLPKGLRDDFAEGTKRRFL